MVRSLHDFVTSFSFHRMAPLWGILVFGVGCTIAPINCAQPVDEDENQNVDAGAATDAGADDAGSAANDAGTEGDAGTTASDAGAEPTDGGAVPSDGGATGDAGPAACTDVDPDLGTLVLADGYVRTDSASIPDDVIAVAPYIGGDASVHLAVLRGGDLTVRDLGTWPDLGEDTLLFQLVADDDDVESPYASSYLVGNGTLLAAGYTAYDATTFGFPGKIAIWNGTEVSYLQADGNYSASISDEILMINGLGAGDIGDAAGIYGAGLENDVWVAKELATFPSDWSAYSGYNAVTSDGIALLGGYFTYDDTMSNHLLAVPASELNTAWETGTPLSLEDKPVVASGDMLSVATMGPLLAILRGAFGEVADGVFVTQLQTEMDTGSTVGIESAVLTSVDDCTPIHFISTFEDDLMVAVGNVGAMKLLRISHAE